MARVFVTGVLQDGSQPGPGVPENPRVDISMVRGETLVVGVTIVNRDGSPVDLMYTANAVVLRIKYAARYSGVIVQKNGSTAPNRPINYVEFTISPTDMRFIEPGRYVYDVFLSQFPQQQGEGVENAVVPLSAFVLQPGLVYP